MKRHQISVSATAIDEDNDAMKSNYEQPVYGINSQIQLKKKVKIGNDIEKKI